jgi:uncharacterized protein YndB with AHSA1/START domain
VIELAARTRTLPPPPHVLWAALVAPLASGGRSWFELREDEVEPAILEAREPGQVVWSTLWPDRPDDRIELRLLADREGSRLTFTWLSPGPTPDGATLGRRRRRLNELFWADLRYSFGQ